MTDDGGADIFDVVVIGGGINGAGLARDAAGRGLRVLLCEKDDLAQGTSSRSGKYIHGGLRYLEYYEFRLVREALIEREVLLSAAPHIIWPMRMVIPHSPEQRPQWVIRMGLFLYDHLGGRKKLPGTRSIDLRREPEGRSIRPHFTSAFEYADCWVDDARLVLLSAIDAAERGAVVLPRTACTSARRENGLWRAELMRTSDRGHRTIRARALINAAGPWVEQVLGNIAGVNSKRRVRLVKGSHIVTRKWWDGPQAYVLQNTDKRLIFVNPYQDDLALIGTTDIPYEGQPERVQADVSEIDYLVGVLQRYFINAPTQPDVLSTFSGVRPLYDDDAQNPSAVTRDYVFEVDGGAGQAPMLSVFGGKITTYRKLAEHALEKLRPFFPQMKAPWTADARLPGGDLPNEDADSYVRQVSAERPWLPPGLARHYVRLYGTRLERLLDGARGLQDLGRDFGGLLYEREACWAIEQEWANTADDILERRTKHYLRLNALQKSAFSEWVAKQRD
jgi:glycerol-3-phosphate dehydrogenase